jgi:hypothetical protein
MAEEAPGARIFVDGLPEFHSAKDAIEAIATQASIQVLEDRKSATEILVNTEFFNLVIAKVQQMVDDGKIKIVGGKDGFGPCGRTAEGAIIRAKVQHELLMQYKDLPALNRVAIRDILGRKFISHSVTTEDGINEMDTRKFETIIQILSAEEGVDFLQAMMRLNLPAGDLAEVTRTVRLEEFADGEDLYDEEEEDEDTPSRALEELTGSILISDKDRPLEEGLYDSRITPEMLERLHRAYQKEMARDSEQEDVVQSFMWIICAVQWKDWKELQDTTKDALLDLHLIQVLKSYWILNGTIEARDLFDLVGLLVSSPGGETLIAGIRSGQQNLLRKVAEIAKRYGQLTQAGIVQDLYALKLSNITSIASKVSLQKLQEEDDLDTWKMALTDEFRAGNSYFEDALM